MHSELEADESLQQFATWCVLAEHCGPEWPLWPPDFRSPGDPAIATFAAAHADRIRFHIWLQHVLSTQFAAASTDVGIIQDLPIGFSPTGADAWAWQSLLAPTVSVGAPPDEFNTSGQDWGLPPFVPHKLRAADYRPFIETIRATMSANGGVRIDHVMGLSRLWWIPDSNHPRDGAYVRYPADDLLDIVALESVRNSAVVVGEDLGTVEPAMRVCLEDHDVLSYRLLWFEEDRPARWPVRAMAALTTHDLPTVAGLWDGSDLEEQRQLDLDPNVEGQLEMRERLRRASGLAHDAPSDVAVISAHQLLASAPSTLLCATLDDALVEPRRPNIPGVAGGRPNWSIALPRAIDELFDDQLATSIAHTLNAAISG